MYTGFNIRATTNAGGKASEFSNGPLVLIIVLMLETA